MNARLPKCSLCYDGYKCGDGYVCPQCGAYGFSLLHWEAGKELELSLEERERRRAKMAGEGVGSLPIGSGF